MATTRVQAVAATGISFGSPQGFVSPPTAGNLLVCVFGGRDNANAAEPQFSASGGWEIVGVADPMEFHTVGIAWRQADGTATDEAVTISSDIAVSSTWIGFVEFNNPGITNWAVVADAFAGAGATNVSNISSGSTGALPDAAGVAMLVATSRTNLINLSIDVGDSLTDLDANFDADAGSANFLARWLDITSTAAIDATATEAEGASRMGVGVAVFGEAVVANPAVTDYSDSDFTDTWGNGEDIDIDPGVDWQPGDTIVVVAMGENEFADFGTPVHADLTFDAQVTLGATASQSTVRVWTALADTVGTAEIIVAEQTGGITSNMGIGVIVVSDVDYASISVQSNRTESAFSVDPTEGSVVVYGMADWEAENPHTLLTGTGTPAELVDFFASGAYSGVIGTWTETTAGAANYGVSTYAGKAVSHFALALPPVGDPTEPDAPAAPTLTSTRARRVDLSWAAPANGGSAITDYIIERAPDSGGSPGTYSAVSDGTSTTTSYTDTGITAGIYWYRISAVNAIGTSDPSSAASVTVTNHPGIKSSNTQQGTSLSAAANFTLPTGAASGDLVLYFISSDATGGTAITASTGWTELGTQTITSNVHHAKVFGRVLDGTTGNNILNPNGAAQDYTSIGICIDASEHGVTNATILTDIGLAGTFSASNGSANPPTLTPGFNDWLWLAYATIDKSASGNNITASPSNYGLVQQSNSAASTTSSYAWLASRRHENSSQDPGTFTNSSRPWIAFTLSIPPSVTDQDIPMAVAVLSLSGVAPSLANDPLHAWFGDEGEFTPSAEDTPVELGTHFSVDEAFTIVGIRIRNPGEGFDGTPGGRFAKLWYNASVDERVELLQLPDTLPAGWSTWLFEHSFVVIPGEDWAVSYNIDGDDPTLADYFIDVNAFAGGPIDFGPGTLDLGAFGTVGLLPTTVFNDSFYGVDLLYFEGAVVPYNFGIGWDADFGTFTEGSDLTLAAEFNFDGDATVVGVRIHSDGVQSGSGRSIYVWEDDGTLLDTFNLPDLVAGWNWVEFDTPVDAPGGIGYRIGYDVPTGSEYDSVSSIAPFVRGPITFVEGYFTTALATFPTSDSGNWYGIDPLIEFADVQPQGIVTPTAELVLSGLAPSISGSGASEVAVPLALLALSGISPSLDVPIDIAVVPAALQIAGLPIAAAGSGEANITIPMALVTLAGLSPSIVGVGVSEIVVPSSDLLLSGQPLTLIGAGAFVIPVGEFQLSGIVPQVSGEGDVSFTVPLGTMVVSGVSLDTSGSGSAGFVIPPGLVSVSGEPLITIASGQASILIPASVLTIGGVPVVLGTGAVTPVIFAIPAAALELLARSPSFGEIQFIDIDGNRWTVEMTPFRLIISPDGARGSQNQTPRRGTISL